MSATTTTTKKRVKSHKGHSEKYAPPTSAPPAGKADNGAQRDYDRPIHYQNLIPDKYDHDNDNEE